MPEPYQFDDVDEDDEDDDEDDAQRMKNDKLYLSTCSNRVLDTHHV